MNIYYAIAISVGVIASGATGFYLDRALTTSAVTVCPQPAKTNAATKRFFNAPEIPATGHKGF